MIYTIPASPNRAPQQSRSNAQPRHQPVFKGSLLSQAEKQAGIDELLGFDGPVAIFASR